MSLSGARRRVVPSNPLELSAAALFAVLFVAISIASTWAADHFGAAGLYVIAAIVGVTDIDPFVLSIAQGGASSLTGADAAVAVLTATASNNLLKAAYTVGFTGHRRGLPVVGTLVPALRRSGVDRIRVNPALTDDLGSVQAG
jgi:uncharacterized membrane protein (DUF4010 family)